MADSVLLTPCFFPGAAAPPDGARAEQKSRGLREMAEGEYAGYFVHKTVDLICYCFARVVLVASYIEKFVIDYVKENTWIYSGTQMISKAIPYCKMIFVANLYYALNNFVELCIKRHELNKEEFSDLDFVTGLATHFFKMGSCIMEILDGIAGIVGLKNWIFQSFSLLQIFNIASTICAAINHCRTYLMAQDLVVRLEALDDQSVIGDLTFLNEPRYQEALRRIFDCGGDDLSKSRDFQLMLQQMSGGIVLNRQIKLTVNVDPQVVPQQKLEGAKKFVLLKEHIKAQADLHKWAFVANIVDAVASATLLFGPLIVAACPPLLFLALHLQPICYAIKSAASFWQGLNTLQRWDSNRTFSWDFKRVGAPKRPLAETAATVALKDLYDVS